MENPPNREPQFTEVNRHRTNYAPIAVSARCRAKVIRQDALRRTSENSEPSAGHKGLLNDAHIFECPVAHLALR